MRITGTASTPGASAPENGRFHLAYGPRDTTGTTKPISPRQTSGRLVVCLESNPGLRGFPMSNSFLTTSKITREAVRLFVNSNMFIRNVDRQ